MTQTGARAGAIEAPALRARRRLRADRALPYALVAPLVVFIVGLALVPALFTTVEAFFRVSPLDPPTRFAGLDNFRALFDNDAVRAAAVNTLLYVVIGVSLSTLLGIVMALSLQQPFRGRSAVIAVLVLPWALPGVVEALIWSGIFDANSGLLNSVLAGLHITGSYPVLVGKDRFATIGLIELVQVWQMTPLSTLLILAVLQVIPRELYDAARIDGCSPWGLVRHITLPLARPGIAIAMVQALVATLNVFDQPYVLNGAASTGSSVMMQTYFLSFRNLDFGAGYALSLLVTVTTLVLAVAVVRLVYRRVDF
jgi:ABC-type sugar transport system permease subunit